MIFFGSNDIFWFQFRWIFVSGRWPLVMVWPSLVSLRISFGNILSTFGGKIITNICHRCTFNSPDFPNQLDLTNFLVLVIFFNSGKKFSWVSDYQEYPTPRCTLNWLLEATWLDQNFLVQVLFFKPGERLSWKSDTQVHSELTGLLDEVRRDQPMGLLLGRAGVSREVSFSYY